MTGRNDLVLTVKGRDFGDWMGFKAERRLEHMATALDLNIAESWGTNAAPWQLRKFDPFVLTIGSDLLMTGYIDDYLPEISETTHSVRVTGRSKTEDLIDNSPDIQSGQFRGYTLGAIAKSICAPFKIDVLDQANSTITFPDATLQRSETAFTFLQRLGRLASVLLTDDEQGRLVLTQTGTARSSGRLVQGVNVKRAKARISGQKQHSIYIVIGQHAIGSASAPAGGFGDDTDGPTSPAPAPVATQMRATATDTSVPRYRPRTTTAEAQLDQAGMQARANWERNYAYGRSTQADFTVVGWRQPDGRLWKTNEIVPVTAPYLEIDQDLLIVGTTFSLDPKLGHVTEITVAPVEGYTPEPGQVKKHTKRGKKGSHFDAGGFGDS